jgi:hypothetical protein
VFINSFQFGFVSFRGNATAGSATINNSALIHFRGNSTAGNATITTDNGGATVFFGNSTAGNATIITNNGATAFLNNSTGGNARFITNAAGFVDFSSSTGPAGDGNITAGSIEGAGNYFIGGGNTLAVGSNNLSTEVSGVIADNNPWRLHHRSPLAGQRRHPHALPLRGQQLYRHHRCEWRHAHCQRLDCKLEPHAREQRRRARRHRRGGQHAHQ